MTNPDSQPQSDTVPSAGQPVLGAHDQNPSDVPLSELLLEDLRTHGGRLTAPGFWALAVHRFGNWRMNVKSKALRAPLTALYDTSYHAVRWLWGIDLSYVVKVGRRVRFDHHGAVMVGAHAVGNDVVFRHSAVVGVMNRNATTEKPTIEDRVEIGARACIVGKSRIGHDTVVCANTVVPTSVPPHSTVLGVPGRLVDLGKHVDE